MFRSGLAIAFVRTEDAEDSAHGNGDVVFTVSGRLEAYNVRELSELLAGEQSGRRRADPGGVGAQAESTPTPLRVPDGPGFSCSSERSQDRRRRL